MFIAKGLRGVPGHRDGSRDVRQWLTIRSAEPKIAIRLPLHLETLLVDGAVMAAA